MDASAPSVFERKEKKDLSAKNWAAVKCVCHVPCSARASSPSTVKACRNITQAALCGITGISVRAVETGVEWLNEIIFTTAWHHMKAYFVDANNTRDVKPTLGWAPDLWAVRRRRTHRCDVCRQLSGRKKTVFWQSVSQPREVLQPKLGNPQQNIMQLTAAEFKTRRHTLNHGRGREPSRDRMLSAGACHSGRISLAFIFAKYWITFKLSVAKKRNPSIANSRTSAVSLILTTTLCAKLFEDD